MLFRRRTLEHLDDRVWTTAKLKFEGICREVAATSGKCSMVVTAAHESATLFALKTFFDDARLRYVIWEALPSLSEFDFDRHIGEATQTVLVPSRLASEARRLVPLLRLGSLLGSTADNGSLLMIVAERAMLPGRDRDVIAFAEGLPWRTKVRFHASMEDPLLQAAGPDRVASLMKSLGWDGQVPFSHPSVTALITLTQKYPKASASAEKRNIALFRTGRKPERRVRS